MSSTDDALALEVRGHAEQRADGDDAGAADAGDQDAVGLGESPAASGSGSGGNSPLPAFAGFRSGRPRR